MKKTRWSLFMILAMALTISGCFEVREHVNFRKDGSGTFTMILDLSDVRQVLQNFAGTDDPENGTPFQSMEKQFDEIRLKLEKIEGISAVRLQSEKGGYLLKTGFDFASPVALNRGLDILYNKGEESKDEGEYYRMKRKRFERTEAHNFVEMIREEISSGSRVAGGMDLSILFSDVVYINEITFDGREIRRVRSGNAVIAENRKSATNRYYIFRDPDSQETAFRLKLD